MNNIFNLLFGLVCERFGMNICHDRIEINTFNFGVFLTERSISGAIVRILFLKSKLTTLYTQFQIEFFLNSATKNTENDTTESQEISTNIDNDCV